MSKQICAPPRASDQRPRLDEQIAQLRRRQTALTGLIDSLTAYAQYADLSTSESGKRQMLNELQEGGGANDMDRIREQVAANNEIVEAMLRARAGVVSNSSSKYAANQPATQITISIQTHNKYSVIH